MSPVRRVSASFALAALVSPFAAGAALTMHVGALLPSHHVHHDGDHDVDVNDHHDVNVAGHHDDSDDPRDDHDHASDFQQVWHGHRHDQTTPEHTHPSAFTNAPLTLGPAAPRVIPSHGSHAFEPADDSGGSLDADAVVALAGPAPSPPAEPPAILRI